MLQDILPVSFAVSGVTTSLLVPPVIAFVVSFFSSMGGVSGAFLLLPFQVSALHYTAPSVSATNLLYNIVSIPSGVYRYFREGRLFWPLTLVITVGTLPGVFAGYLLRVSLMPDPRSFKLFVGCVLLAIGMRLLFETAGWTGADPRAAALEKKLRNLSRERSASAGLPADAVVRTTTISLRSISYEFCGEPFSFSPAAMLCLSLVVGIIGGAYGIGGGAIIAPFCVAVFRLPVYTVAGAALFGTMLTSIAGVAFYSLVPGVGGVPSPPDWPLGILFGAGGFCGMYLGARFQKFMPQKIIKMVLVTLLLFVSYRYISRFFQ